MTDAIIQLAHVLLMMVYLVGPIVFVALRLRKWRRARGEDARVRRALILDTVLRLVVAASLGGGLVLVYATATGGGIGAASTGEVVKAAYLTVGLLLLLTAVDAATSGLMRRMTESEPGRRQLGRRGGRAVVLFARVVVFAMVGLPFLMAAAMVYRPRVVPPESPRDYGLTYSEAAFTAADGTQLAGWWIDAGDVDAVNRPGRRNATVVLVHGLGGGKFDLLPTAAGFNLAGYDVLLFDLRAHGASEGNLTSFGDRERLDVEAAVAFAREQKPRQPVYGVALSMGGAAALAARDEDGGSPFDALAVIETYGRWSDLAEDLVDRQFTEPIRSVARWVALPAAMASSGRNLSVFNPIDQAADMWPTPLLVVHSRGDTLINFRHGKELFDVADQPKRSLWLDGYDHNDVIMQSIVIESMLRFFDEAQELGVRQIV